jgi:hypothetical protein
MERMMGNRVVGRKVQFLAGAVESGRGLPQSKTLRAHPWPKSKVCASSARPTLQIPLLTDLGFVFNPILQICRAAGASRKFQD